MPFHELFSKRVLPTLCAIFVCWLIFRAADSVEFNTENEDEQLTTSVSERRTAAATSFSNSDTTSVPPAVNTDTPRDSEDASALESSDDIRSLLEAQFKRYDAYLKVHMGPIPTWWGRRDIYKDLEFVDPKAIVLQVTCATDLCAVDIYHPELPPLGDFDGRIVNQPSFLGGAYTRRYDSDPTRMRIYVLAANMEAGDEDSEFPPKDSVPKKS